MVLAMSGRCSHPRPKSITSARFQPFTQFYDLCKISFDLVAVVTLVVVVVAEAPWSCKHGNPKQQACKKQYAGPRLHYCAACDASCKKGGSCLAAWLRIANNGKSAPIDTHMGREEESHCCMIHSNRYWSSSSSVGLLT